MSEQAYKIHRTARGKISVKYRCTNCGESLENELAEAGEKDTCPQCNFEFVVPGQTARENHERQMQQRKAARERQIKSKKQSVASRIVNSLPEIEAEEAQPEEPLQAQEVDDEIEVTLETIAYEIRDFHVKYEQLEQRAHRSQSTAGIVLLVCGCGLFGLAALGMSEIAGVGGIMLFALGLSKIAA